MNCSLKERNDLETAFFQSNGAYRQLDCGSVGIGELCDRLRRMLHKHLLGEPPKVQAEINKSTRNINMTSLYSEKLEKHQKNRSTIWYGWRRTFRILPKLLSMGMSLF